MAINTDELFRYNLKRLITSNFKNEAQAALACGLNPATLNKLVAGGTWFSAKTLNQLCKGFQCGPDEFFLPIEKVKDKAKSINLHNLVFSAEILQKLSDLPPEGRAICLSLIFEDESYLDAASSDRLLSVVSSLSKDL